MTKFSMHTIKREARREAWYGDSSDPFRKVGVRSNTWGTHTRSQNDLEFDEPILPIDQHQQPAASKLAVGNKGSEIFARYKGNHDSSEDLGVATGLGVADSGAEDTPVPSSRPPSLITISKDETGNVRSINSYSNSLSACVKSREVLGELRARRRFIDKLFGKRSPVEDDDNNLKDTAPKRPWYRGKILKHKPFTVRNQLQATIFNSWFNVLLLVGPAICGIVPYFAGASRRLNFVLNFVAIIPLAVLLSFATENIWLQIRGRIIISALSTAAAARRSSTSLKYTATSFSPGKYNPRTRSRTLKVSAMAMGGTIFSHLMAAVTAAPTSTIGPATLPMESSHAVDSLEPVQPEANVVLDELKSRLQKLFLGTFVIIPSAIIIMSSLAVVSLLLFINSRWPVAGFVAMFGAIYVYIHESAGADVLVGTWLSWLLYTATWCYLTGKELQFGKIFALLGIGGGIAISTLMSSSPQWSEAWAAATGGEPTIGTTLLPSIFLSFFLLDVAEYIRSKLSAPDTKKSPRLAAWYDEDGLPRDWSDQIIEITAQSWTETAKETVWKFLGLKNLRKQAEGSSNYTEASDTPSTAATTATSLHQTAASRTAPSNPSAASG